MAACSTARRFPTRWRLDAALHTLPSATSSIAPTPASCLDAYRPGELARLIGIQANGSSRDVTTLDGSAATVTEPVESWCATMRALHEIHAVPILGGCCGTSLPHLEALAGLA
ncbi:MAG: homocysteine S-methyltransferase family protein [Gammaproteobacteria bacterium]|nr:homocysteine S-methyltransferase family protein [Gammaproteobacteria bacterium]